MKRQGAGIVLIIRGCHFCLTMKDKKGLRPRHWLHVSDHACTALHYSPFFFVFDSTFRLSVAPYSRDGSYRLRLCLVYCFTVRLSRMSWLLILSRVVHHFRIFVDCLRFQFLLSQPMSHLSKTGVAIVLQYLISVSVLNLFLMFLSVNSFHIPSSIYVTYHLYRWLWNTRPVKVIFFLIFGY